MQTRTAPLGEFPEGVRTDLLAQATRGILVLALVLGSLGADAAASSGPGSADHTSAHQPSGDIRLALSVQPINPRRTSPDPWMY